MNSVNIDEAVALAKAAKHVCLDYGFNPFQEMGVYSVAHSTIALADAVLELVEENARLRANVSGGDTAIRALEQEIDHLIAACRSALDWITQSDVQPLLHGHEYDLIGILTRAVQTRD